MTHREPHVSLPTTDPHVRRLDRDELPVCGECHSFMLPLAPYNVPKGSALNSDEADAVEYAIWGWWAPIYNFFYDILTHPARQRKLEQIKGEVLPKYPNSMVCPRCFHILRRP